MLWPRWSTTALCGASFCSPPPQVRLRSTGLKRCAMGTFLKWALKLVGWVPKAADEVRTEAKSDGAALAANTAEVGKAAEAAGTTSAVKTPVTKQ